MSNQNNSPNEELLDILHKTNNEDPRKKYVVTSLPNDIEKLFDEEKTDGSEPDDRLFKHRGNPWQFWYNNSFDVFEPREKKDYVTTLYALHYTPKLEYENENIRYDINSDEDTQNQVLEFVKDDFKQVTNLINQHVPFTNMRSEEEQRNASSTNPEARKDYEIPTLEQLFQSEKANIAAITMQADEKLNKSILNFIIRLIIIVREGIIA